MVFKFKKQNEVKVVKVKLDKPKKERKGLNKVLAKIGNFFAKGFKKINSYFKGSWVELKQVRWPNRRAAWSLTGAVILFTALFLGLIILLDAGFDLLFKLIIK